jgi:hypothetical protein
MGVALMARFKDPYAKLGEVEPDTQEAAKRRRDRARADAVRERAKWLLDNDPDVNDLVNGRRVAREQLDEIDEFDALVAKGYADPETGQLTKTGRQALGPKTERSNRSPRQRGRAGTNRPANRGTRRFVRDTARTVTAPFGNAASAGWTAFQGGLSLVLLYVVLRDADTIGFAARAVAGGIRRIGDPYVPLIPDFTEASPAKSEKKTANAQGGRKS